MRKHRDIRYFSHHCCQNLKTSNLREKGFTVSTFRHGEEGTMTGGVHGCGSSKGRLLAHISEDQEAGLEY